GVSPTNPVGEVDLTNTQDVKFSNPFIGGGNGNSIHVFDRRNGTTFVNSVQNTRNNWDGDELVYANQDVNGDHTPDGIFFLLNYGLEDFLIADDSSVLLIGKPDGLPGDTPAPEIDAVFGSADQTLAGLAFDADFTGYNEL